MGRRAVRGRTEADVAAIAVALASLVITVAMLVWWIIAVVPYHWAVLTGGSVLLGLFAGAGCEVNPPSNRVITAQDQMLVVRSRPVDRVGFEAVARR